jgi:hypothetical protein
MSNPHLDRTELETAAKATGGGFYTLADAGNLLNDLPEGRRNRLNASGDPYLLWANVGLFLFVLALLTTEWLLRKDSNLL